MTAARSPTSAAAGDLEGATLRRAQAGQAADQEALVRAFERPVFALLGRMLVPRGRQAQVSDLAQETFIRVLRALPRFDPDGPARLSSWILTIATRVALDDLRRPRVVEEPLEAMHEPADTSAGDLGDRIALRAALYRALAGLDPEQQAVVLLGDAHGLPYEEIAEALSVKLGTVKSRLHRARAALRAALRGETP